MLIVGFTGSQDGCTTPQLASLRDNFQVILENHDEIEFHHGDCIGADKQAHDIWDEFRQGFASIRIVIHPPINLSKRANCIALYPWGEILEPKPYLERNLDIVMVSNMMFGCPKTSYETIRSGTWSTIRRAREYKKLLHIHLPNGEIKTENGESYERNL